MADSVTMRHPKYPDVPNIEMPPDRVASKEAIGWVVVDEPSKGSRRKAKSSSASADEPSAEER